MKKHFYHQHANIESLSLYLDELNLSRNEKKQLLLLASDSLHHAVLDALLSELSEKDKKIFLENLASENHDQIWKHLKESIQNVEEKIKKTAETLKKDLQKDIEETKKSG